MLMGGEIGNFSALGFATPVVVAPLGAVSVVTNVVLAVALLEERINWRQAAGIGCILVGTAMIVMCAPQPDPAFSLEVCEGR